MQFHSDGIVSMLGLMLIRFGRHSAFSQVSKCYGLIFTINMFDGTHIQGSPQVRELVILLTAKMVITRCRSCHQGDARAATHVCIHMRSHVALSLTLALSYLQLSRRPDTRGVLLPRRPSTRHCTEPSHTNPGRLPSADRLLQHKLVGRSIGSDAKASRAS